MVSGMDKYFQIVKCFRDEDLRQDRHPEFTQIDIEMSFGNEKILFQMIEEMMAAIYKEVLNEKISIPFPVLKYQDAIDRVGTDKPDMRIDMEIVDGDPRHTDRRRRVIATSHGNGSRIQSHGHRE